MLDCSFTEVKVPWFLSILENSRYLHIRCNKRHVSFKLVITRVKTAFYNKKEDIISFFETWFVFRSRLPEVFCKKCSLKFRKIHRKTAVPGSFCNKVLGKYGPEISPYLDTFHAVDSRSSRPGMLDYMFFL